MLCDIKLCYQLFIKFKKLCVGIVNEEIICLKVFKPVFILLTESYYNYYIFVPVNEHHMF